jgi:acyl-CoA thioesterase
MDNMQYSQNFDKKTLDGLNERLKNTPLWKLVDMRVTALSPGKSEMTMQVKDTYLNNSGVCHGGITATFADTVMGVALYTTGSVGPTVEMNINYMVPVTAGQRITGRAEVLRRGRTTAVVRADMFVDKTIVAAARGTYSIIEYNKD